MILSLRKTLVLLSVLSCLCLMSFGVPMGWFVAGSEPAKYDMGIDAGAGREGSSAATIKSTEKKINGFGTLMQNMAPGKYFGHKVKMTGYMRSANVDGWAGFWMRVDKEGGSDISFDNMSDRPVKGNTDWTKYEIVVKVTDVANNIAFGALLDGTGQIWFDDIHFEIVDDSVPLTGRFTKDSKPKEAQNLDFESK